MHPMLRAVTPAMLFALPLACVRGPTETSVVKAVGSLDAELIARCEERFETWGDAAIHYGWVEHCTGWWAIAGQPSPIPVDMPRQSDGMRPIAALSSEAHRSVATTTDGQTWWVHYVGPKAGWLSGEDLFRLPAGATDLEAYGGIAGQAKARYAEVGYGPRRRQMLALVAELEGEAALVDVLIATFDQSPDGSSDDVWLEAAQGLRPPARQTVEQALRASVLGPTRTLPALARLIGLDERAAAADPEIAPLAWTMARQALADNAPLRIPDIHAEKDTPVPLAGRLLTTLLGGDAFGAHPEASPIACGLLQADPLALSGSLLAAALSATTRGEACPLDQTWLDTTQRGQPGSEPAHICLVLPPVSDTHAEGPACRARLDAITRQIPVEGGVGDVTRDPCIRWDGQPLHPAASAWYYAASHGLDASTSRFDRLTYTHVTGAVACEGAPPGARCIPNRSWAFNVCSAAIDDTSIRAAHLGMDITVDHPGRRLIFTGTGP